MKYFSLVGPIALITALLALLALGCAMWASRQVYGKTEEVQRRLVGPPQLVARTAPEKSEWFTPEQGRQHCVQQAEVTYKRSDEIVPITLGRKHDVIGGVLLMVAGVVSGIVAMNRSDSMANTGEVFSTRSPDPVVPYLIGGALTAGGVGWIGYSYSQLPLGPAPTVSSSTKTWQELRFVEALGCAVLVVPTFPGGVPTVAPPANDTKARLQELEELRQSGLLSDEEYATKRAEILRGL